MKKTRTIVGIMLVALLALSGCALCACGSQISSGSSSSSSQQQGKDPGGAGKGGMGGTDKSSDAELQAMIAEVAHAFAQASADRLNKSIGDMLAVGDAINFITWEAGTVLGSSSQSGGTSEHMASFDYGYKLSRVRDWIFEQHK